MSTLSRATVAAAAGPLRWTFSAAAVVPLALHGTAALAACAPLALLPAGATLPALALLPALYVLALAALAGGLARTVAPRIEPGRFARTQDDAAYVARRLYGACWTTLYYCKPAYSLLLSIPAARRWVFELFGYRGRSLDFTVYPDSWIRDLPLLDFDEGVYVSNRATIGTNVVRPGGAIHVDRVSIGARSIVGHLAMIGPGARIGADVEIGVGSAIGFKVALADGVRIGGRCVVDHATRIGAGTRIGHSVHVGLRCAIGARLNLPAGLVVPDHTRLDSQESVDRLAGRRPRLDERAR